MTDTLKKCSKCKIEKSVREFCKRDNVRDGKKSICKDCMNKFSRIYYVKNQSKLREQARNRQRRKKEENPAGVFEYRSEYRARNRFERALTNARKAAKELGHMPCKATKEELSVAFIGRCAICGVPEVECRNRLCVDHCHESGQFRGFLCSSCNRALGYFRENKHIVKAAYEYLEDNEYKVKENVNECSSICSD